VTDRQSTVDLSLVSHTNQGKTTLVRTLLRREVGEVLDQAHVTDENVPYELIVTGEHKLILWDTPGFGDSARLLKRLEGHDNPLGWFQGQVLDRLADRPMWCGQQAVTNVREDADLVLYLVNGSESPDAAGYLEPELKILEWIAKPVIVVLNQTGPPLDTADARAEVERWRAWAARHLLIRDVISLDAFTRCWVQEGVLFERVVDSLAEGARATMRELVEAWHARNATVFRDALSDVATFLTSAATDRVPLVRNDMAERRNASARLREEVRRRMRELSHALIELHGLEGRSERGIETDIADLVLPQTAADDKRSAIWGGVLGGLGGGLLADVLSGGLTLGGGMIGGTLVGLLGGLGYARTQKVLKGEDEPALTWTPEFLKRLTAEALLLYLAVAHYGRGRGDYRDLEQPKHWNEAIETALSGRMEGLANAARDGDARFEALLRTVLEDVLRRLYPEAGPALARAATHAGEEEP